MRRLFVLVCLLPLSWGCGARDDAPQDPGATSPQAKANVSPEMVQRLQQAKLNFKKKDAGD